MSYAPAASSRPGPWQPMLNPLKWKYEDQVGLIIATAFGALLGLVNGYAPGHEWFNLLWAVMGAVVIGGAVYCYRAFFR